MQNYSIQWRQANFHPIDVAHFQNCWFWILSYHRSKSLDIHWRSTSILMIKNIARKNIKMGLELRISIYSFVFIQEAHETRCKTTPFSGDKQLWSYRCSTFSKLLILDFGVSSKQPLDIRWISNGYPLEIDLDFDDKKYSSKKI